MEVAEGTLMMCSSEPSNQRWFEHRHITHHHILKQNNESTWLSACSQRSHGDFLDHALMRWDNGCRVGVRHLHRDSAVKDSPPLSVCRWLKARSFHLWSPSVFEQVTSLTQCVSLPYFLFQHLWTSFCRQATGYVLVPYGEYQFDLCALLWG